MDDFTFYFGYGWNHIISMQALDHLLFLIALIAGYSTRHLRQVAILVTGFTIGHAITLAMSIYDEVRFDMDWVEFLIPLTIVLTCSFNLFRHGSGPAMAVPYLMALLFGFIHGMGFANTLRFMLAREQGLAKPLLGFNLGIETAQILVVLLLLLIHFILVHKLKLSGKWWTFSLLVGAGLTALYMCITRWPL